MNSNFGEFTRLNFEPKKAPYVSLWFIIISLVFFFLCEVLFLGFLQFKAILYETEITQNKAVTELQPMRTIDINLIGVMTTKKNNCRYRRSLLFFCLLLPRYNSTSSIFLLETSCTEVAC